MSIKVTRAKAIDLYNAAERHSRKESCPWYIDSHTWLCQIQSKTAHYQLRAKTVALAFTKDNFVEVPLEDYVAFEPLIKEGKTLYTKLTRDQHITRIESYEKKLQCVNKRLKSTRRARKQEMSASERKELVAERAHIKAEEIRVTRKLSTLYLKFDNLYGSKN